MLDVPKFNKYLQELKIKIFLIDLKFFDVIPIVMKCLKHNFHLKIWLFVFFFFNIINILNILFIVLSFAIRHDDQKLYFINNNLFMSKNSVVF